MFFDASLEDKSHIKKWSSKALVFTDIHFFDTFILFWYFLIRISCYLLVFAHTMCWVKLFLIRFDAFWYVLIFSDTFFDTFFDTCIFWYIFWYVVVFDIFWYTTCVFDTQHVFLIRDILHTSYWSDFVATFYGYDGRLKIKTHEIVELRHPIPVKPTAKDLRIFLRIPLGWFLFAYPRYPHMLQ